MIRKVHGSECGGGSRNLPRRILALKGSCGRRCRPRSCSNPSIGRVLLKKMRISCGKSCASWLTCQRMRRASNLSISRTHTGLVVAGCGRSSTCALWYLRSNTYRRLLKSRVAPPEATPQARCLRNTVSQAIEPMTQCCKPSPLSRDRRIARS